MAQLNSITASAIEIADSQSRGCMIHIVMTLCSVSSTARVDLSVDVPLPSSLTVRTLGENGLPTHQILCPDPMAEHRVVRWRPSGTRPQGQACGYRMEIYQPLRTGLWLLHGRRLGQFTFTTLYPAADKYPYMFKIVLVICTLGNPCVQFVEDTHRTYVTQDQCLDRAEIKYQQMTQTLQDNGFMIADSGYYCIQDDSI